MIDYLKMTGNSELILHV